MASILNDKGERIAMNWWGGSFEMVRCPFPECTHTGMGITKAHCRNAHSMEREQIGELYGKPRIFETKGAILSQYNGYKYNHTGSQNIF